MTRTTVTLTPDADALVRKVMRERDLTFKQAVNAAILDGLSSTRRQPEYQTPTFRLGVARASLDRALSLAGELEDEELLRRREVGK